MSRSLPPGLPRLRADRTKLVQVLINLVKNAGEAFDLGYYGDARFCGWGGGLPVAQAAALMAAVTTVRAGVALARRRTAA